MGNAIEATGDEIELISDGDGLAVIGEPTAVERFLGSLGLDSRELDLSRVSAISSAGAAVAQAGSVVASNSGRWVKMTEKSAKAVKDSGLMNSNALGESHAMIGKPGDIKQWIQLEQGVGALASNPAMLAGVAGIMTQVAMQQSIREITDYLAKIDEKLDAVLRSQRNQALARLDGIDLAVKEASTVRDAVGRVSEVTWSKVQASSSTIFETQGYVIRQLADLADKLEQDKRVDEIVKTTREAVTEVPKYLSVLARCFQLHDAVAVLELDRVLDESADEIDRHRLGLKAARQERLELISQTTASLLERMADAAARANSKVLLNPIQSPAVVESSNHVAVEVHEFRGLLGIESERQSSEARGWKNAASERWEKTRETGAGGIGAAKGLGGEGLDRAKSVKGKLSGKLGDRKFRRGKGDDESDDEG